MLLLHTNLTARAKTALRSPAAQLIGLVQAVWFAIASLVVRNTLGIAAAAERIRWTLQTLRRLFIRVVPAVVLIVTHHGLPDAVSVATPERPLVASVRLTVLTLLVRPVQTIIDSIAKPVPQNALAIITPVFVIVTIAVLLVRPINAIVIPIALEVVAYAQVVSLALELIRLAAHVAVRFITMIRTVKFPIALPDPPYAMPIITPELRLRTVSHLTVQLIAVVSTIILVIAPPPPRNAL